MYMLVSHMSNELYVPITCFNSKEKAVNFLKELLPDEPEDKFKFVLGSLVGDRIYNMIKFNNLESEYDKPGDYDIETNGEDITDKLFSSYYGGCGEFYSLILVEIKEGETKIFPFDGD